ncbi:hypothetical protein VYU27_001302 [Nannochloropsis oceanica]
MPFSSSSSSSSSSTSSLAMAAAAMGNSSAPSDVEGYLNKKGRVTWKRRYFTLHGNVISYYTKKGDAKFRNQMVLTAQSTFSDSSSKRNGFSIVTSGKGFQLNAETPEEKRAWTLAVVNAIRSLQRQSAASLSTSSASSSSSSTGSSGSRTMQHSSQGVIVGGKTKKDTKTFYVVGTEFVLDARYELIKPIGHGAYGVVISATDAQLGQKVAIKKCPNAFEDLVDAKRIVREIRLLMHFRHENIVRVLDLQAPPVADFDDVYIISELMDTDLHRVIYSRQKLTEDHVQFFLYQMLCALKYIHSAKVIHRDLKPSNILLNSNCDLKICDFGLSRGVCPVGEQEASDLTEYVVTRWYRAPEIMLSCPEYTTAIGTSLPPSLSPSLPPSLPHFLPGVLVFVQGVWMGVSS